MGTFQLNLNGREVGGVMKYNPLKLIRGTKYTAVDFGHHSLKVIHCKAKADSINLLDHGKINLPRDAIKDGVVEDISLVSRYLDRLISEMGINPGKVLFTSAAGEEFVRKIELPEMPDEELKEALSWEVEEYLNMDPEDVAFDYVKLYKDNNQFNILLVVLPKDVLNGYKEVFNNLNMIPRVAGVQELSLVSLLFYQGEIDKPSAIINIGSEQSRIIIASNDNFFLSRSLEISGNKFTELFIGEEGDMEKAEESKFDAEVKVSENQAEAMDLDLMLAGIDETEHLEKEMIDLADNLVSELNRSLDYFEELGSGESLSELYITGGTFLLNGLKDYIEKKLEINIIEIEPFKNFKVKQDNLDKKIFMAVASGLVAAEVINNED